MSLMTKNIVISVLQKLVLSRSPNLLTTLLAYVAIPVTAGVLVLAILVLKIYYQKQILSQKLNVPGPKPYQFVGMLPYMLKYREIWPTLMTRLSKFYGKTWGCVMPKIGSLPVAYLITHHENNVRHVLRDNFENYNGFLEFI